MFLQNKAKRTKPQAKSTKIAPKTHKKTPHRNPPAQGLLRCGFVGPPTAPIQATSFSASLRLNRPRSTSKTFL